MVGFYVVPLSISKKVQSSAVTFPLAMGWGSESKETIEAFIPHLTEAIAALERDGIEITMPDGKVVQFPVQFHISADMASLWLSSGVGGVHSDQNCMYCESTKESRKCVNHQSHDLNSLENRRDLRIFGLSVYERVHICTLHGITRVTEKLTKLIGGAMYASKSILEAELSSKSAELAPALSLLKKNKAARRGVDLQLKATTDGLAAEVADLRARVSAAPDAEHLVAAIMGAGIGRKSFTVKVEAAASARGRENMFFNVEASSFTGVQAYKLCQQGEAGLASIPFVRVVQQCFGNCGHAVYNFDDAELLKKVPCYSCNVRNCIVAWSAHIVPLLRAQSNRELDAASPGKRFNGSWMKRLCSLWGQLLLDTFGSMGSSSVMSTYIHMFVEHAAYLTVKQGKRRSCSISMHNCCSHSVIAG